MEIAELVLAYLRVLIWPALIVGVAIAFRQEVRDGLSRVRSLRAGGVEVVFLDAVESVASDERLEPEERLSAITAITAAAGKTLPEHPMDPASAARRELVDSSIELIRRLLPDTWRVARSGTAYAGYTAGAAFCLARGGDLVPAFVLTDSELRNGGMAYFKSPTAGSRALVIVAGGDYPPRTTLRDGVELVPSSSLGDPAVIAEAVDGLTNPLLR